MSDTPRPAPPWPLDEACPIHMFVNGGGNLCVKCGHALENWLHQQVKLSTERGEVVPRG